MRRVCIHGGRSGRAKPADGSTTQKTFGYWPTGFLNEATFPGGTLSNSWDADEHRVKMAVNQNEFAFIFDPTASIPAVLQEQTPGNYYDYIREPDGALIAVHEPEVMHWYHFDELGSTRLITIPGGYVSDRYTYDAYGTVLSHDADVGSIPQPYEYVGQLGYYTHWQIPDFGWLQLGVRFYDPQIGRFERRDPEANSPLALVDNVSAYTYASNEPISRTDPTGLYDVDETCRRNGCWGRIAKWIAQINKHMQRSACRKAIAQVGCADIIKPNLAGMEISCALTDPSDEGLCPAANVIEANCGVASVGPGTLIHEAVHSCWWTKHKPYNPDKSFSCVRCRRTWKQADPAWELAAEKVRHACGW